MHPRLQTINLQNKFLQLSAKTSHFLVEPEWFSDRPAGKRKRVKARQLPSQPRAQWHTGVLHGCLLPLSPSLSLGCAEGRRALEDMGTATSTRVQALGPTSHMRTALVTGSVRHALAATEP